MSTLYWEDENEDSLNEVTLASLWFAQVESFDTLPQKRRLRGDRELTFSPSKADACLRELYYDKTDATSDDGGITAWKERRRRNGNAYHRETQFQHRKMVDALREAGLPVHFEVLAMEIDGRASFRVDGTTVTLKGRCDVIARYIGESIPGVVSTGDVILIDYKAKDKLSGVNGVVRKGVPSYTEAQMIAYSLLRFTTDDGREFANIDKAILHYESLQKPKEDETRTKDVLTVDVQPTANDQRRVLVRLAEAVRYIESKTLPPQELDKCYFCSYKKICQEARDESI